MIATEIMACNGAPELCDRRIDQVSFPAAHNAMSNAEIPGWMFPHHSVAFPGQLQNGVRALLIDIHYGFPGGGADQDRPRGRGRHPGKAGGRGG